MQDIRDNFYALPSDADLIFESERLYGSNYNTVNNQALCEYASDSRLKPVRA